MSNPAIVYLSMGVGALIGLAIAVWAMPRILRDFEFQQRYNLVAALVMLVCFVPVIWLAAVRGQHDWWLAFLLVAIGAMLITALRPKRERDSRMDFAQDPTRCGRCHYDLRGTAGPTCPECGWEIPQDASRLERRDWAMWWRGWRIGYLENWKKTLVTLLTFLLLFLGLVAWMVRNGALLPVVMLAGLVTLNFGINVVRVVQYARRHSPTPAPETLPSDS